MQGLSASVVWTVGLALLSDNVEKEEMGRAMGFVALSFSGGALAGPLLGGVVYAKAGYYAVFAMGFALIGLDVILRLLMVEKSVASQWNLTTPVIPRSIPQPLDEIHPAPANLSASGIREVYPDNTETEDQSPPDDHPAYDTSNARFSLWMFHSSCISCCF